MWLEVLGCWCLQQWLWTCPAGSRTSDACDKMKRLRYLFIFFNLTEICPADGYLQILTKYMQVLGLCTLMIWSEAGGQCKHILIISSETSHQQSQKKKKKKVWLPTMIKCQFRPTIIPPHYSSNWLQYKRVLPLSQATGLEVFLDPVQLLHRQLSYTVLQGGVTEYHMINLREITSKRHTSTTRHSHVFFSKKFTAFPKARVCIWICLCTCIDDSWDL